jgi:TrmH family RNA methyltransferase
VAGARRLSQRKHREREGRFLVEGPQAVREALGSGRLIEVYASAAFAVRHPDDAAALAAAGVPVHPCDDAALAALAGSVTPQGVVGVAAADTTTLDEVLSRRPRLLVLLHEVRDLGNAGAVVRVADAAGADAVVLSGQRRRRQRQGRALVHRLGLPPAGGGGEQTSPR